MLGTASVLEYGTVPFSIGQNRKETALVRIDSWYKGNRSKRPGASSEELLLKLGIFEPTKTERLTCLDIQHSLGIRLSFIDDSSSHLAAAKACTPTMLVSSL